MHVLKVLILGPTSFISTLNELKTFLKFNPTFENLSSSHDVILVHEEALKQIKQKELIQKSGSIKILATKNSITFVRKEYCQRRIYINPCAN